jgi:hypothetical protein
MANKYAALAREHWERHAPSRLSELENPVEFFTSLGLEVEAQVSDLASILAGPDQVRESYLGKVARLSTARRMAEEVVMAQLVWIGDPELPLDQAREEWEQTRASDENLVSWAERMQDSPDLMPSSTELEQMAQQWAVPVGFLEGLVASEPPREYLLAHTAVLKEAATIRFLRELR